jgi:cystathionine beta-lyase
MDDSTLCTLTMPISLDGYDSLSVPVYRASTIRYPDAESYLRRFERGPDDYTYGLYGTPTHRHLEQKLTALNRGARTVLVSSGQAAITMAMLAVLCAGDHVLIPDTVYQPVRDFALTDLAPLGVMTTFYDPLDLASLGSAIRPETRLIWVESPGSVTLEMQDIPAIVALARAHGALVGCDNTWSTALGLKPLLLGADIVAEALSKYAGGHSDLLMGAITTASDELGRKIKSVVGRIGMGTSPDDAALILRGLETLPVRLARSGETALGLARWLEMRPEVATVLHPALTSHLGHRLWARDHLAASGVFTICTHEDRLPQLAAGLDELKVFAIGASWGGTKSLIAPIKVASHRSVTRWTGPEHVLRLGIGMEAENDLRDDLLRLLTVLGSTGQSQKQADITAIATPNMESLK